MPFLFPLLSLPLGILHASNIHSFSLISFPAYFVTIYLTSIWYVTLQDVSTRSRLVPTLSVAFIVYLIGQLAIVWSIAHNFVPAGTGGPFMRERAYQVLLPDSFASSAFTCNLHGVKDAPS